MATQTLDSVQAESGLRRVGRELAQQHFLYEGPNGEVLGFLGHFPPPTDAGFRVGIHTRAIAAELERATLAVEAGKSYCVAISTVHRHGKSTLVSRRYPCWHLGRNPEHEVIMVSYAAGLIHEHSRVARACVGSEEYYKTFGLRLSQRSHSVGTWELEGHLGKVNAMGLEAGVTGKGGQLIIVDDPHSGWAAAQSAVERERVWSTLMADVFTRRAPAYAIILVMTRWHPDDVWGRIEKAMEDDPAFPRFKFVTFPARRDDYPGKRHTLFPERYTTEWYKGMRASLGKTRAAALMDCKPMLPGGNRFDVSKFQYVSSHRIPEHVQGAKWVRYWDLASSEKERASANPDYTAGALATVIKGDSGKPPQLWILDMVRVCMEAPERDKIILATAAKDGPRTAIIFETVAGYKDTATRIERQLSGFNTVKRDAKQVSKDVRSQELEPIADAGNVYVVRAPWNEAFVQEMAEVPKGAHDDQHDAVTGALKYLYDPDDWLVV